MFKKVSHVQTLCPYRLHYSYELGWNPSIPNSSTHISTAKTLVPALWRAAVWSSNGWSHDISFIWKDSAGQKLLSGCWSPLFQGHLVHHRSSPGSLLSIHSDMFSKCYKETHFLSMIVTANEILPENKKFCISHLIWKVFFFTRNLEETAWESVNVRQINICILLYSL